MKKLFNLKLFSLVLFLLSFSCLPVFAEGRPKVSVVVPVYGVEKWIRECADSLVNQTLRDIEIIFVDDGSKDNCGAILDEYAARDSRVKVIHKENGGVQKARNTGLDAATGEYIALVDGDDYVDVHTYETAYKLAKKDNVDILNFSARLFNDGNDDHINNIDYSDGKVVSARDYIQNNFKLWVWDNLFKNEVIQKDKIRFVPGIKPADDTCFTYMALGRAKRVKSIPATFYNYRIRPCALSRMTNEDVFVNSYKMFKHICDSWRSGNCLANNEQNLITLIVRWARNWGSTYLKYAGEILESFGSDVYNHLTFERCPEYIKTELKRLEYSAMAKRNVPLQSGIYRIAVGNSNFWKRLDIQGGSKENCANLQIWEVNASPAQDFEIIRHDEGYYTIKALCSGRVLDVFEGRTSPGTNIRQHTSNNSPSQHWYFVPSGNGTFNIISEQNLLAMDVEAGKDANGANVQCWSLNGSNAQKFKFIKANSEHSENKAPISIAMASDKNYAYPMIVSMTSILENKDAGTKIDFYLMLSGDFEQSLKDKILSLRNKYSNCNITIIDMQDKMNSFYMSRHLSRATYYRLMLPSLLPNLDKVLYLDVDIIVRKDLTSLFNYNIDNFYLAGIPDSDVSGKFGILVGRASCCKKDFYVEKYGEDALTRSYVNAGILLFNLKNMRNDDMGSKLMNCISSNNLEFHDQDALNIECYGRILPISNVYNIAAYRNFSDNQVIVHYLTSAKPWNDINTSNSSLWWKYAEKTNCFSEIKEKYLVKDGVYMILSALDHNRAVDIAGGSVKDKANVQLWSKNYTDSQKFNVVYAGDRSYYIVSKCSGKSLDVREGGKKNGTNIWQYKNNDTDSQKWYLIPGKDGYCKVISKCNGLCMDVKGGKSDKGANIHCWSQNGTNAQKFKFDKVG